MNLLTKLLIYKGLTKKGGGITPTGTINITQNGETDVTQYATANVNVPSEYNLNLFVQTTEPSGYKGIWIESDSFEYSNIVETSEQTTASSINIITGTKYTTQMYSGQNVNLDYSFNDIILTDSNNDIIYNTPKVYYGNGIAWVDITQTPLPYIPVEFIQGSGTQWIDTNFLINSGFEIEMEFKMVERGTSSYQYIYGCKNPSGTSYATYCRYDRSDEELELNDGEGGALRTGYGSINYTDLNKIYMKFNSTHIKVMFNETVLKDANINYTLPTTPLGLFILAPALENYGKYKLYSCKIKDNNGDLVHDFIPCIRKSDDEVCLYDAVTTTFFTNAGTGEFIAGSII